MEVSGCIQRTMLEASGKWLQVGLMGTTSEAILREHSAQVQEPFRVHLCSNSCTLVECGERIIHAWKGRKMGGDDEEGWVGGLEAAPRAPEAEAEDQLRGLRHRAAGLAPVDARGGVQDQPERDKEKDKAEKVSSSGSSRRKRKKKKAKKKKEKSKEEKEKELLSGKHPLKASKKEVQSLFAGTGLDSRVKERRRVLRLAQRYATRKDNKKKRSRSSRSSDSEESSASTVEDHGLEGVFTESKKARAIAERYPGALSWETLVAMRRSLLSSTGEEQEEQMVRPTALLYFRYQLASRVAGPQARELVNLTTAIDCLLRGQAAQCLDVLCQRLKAQEASIQGVHWSVGQQMEIPEPATGPLAARPEIEAAQKQSYAESKTKWAAAQSGSPSGKKGDYKGKGKGKADRGEHPKGENRGKKGDGKAAEKK